MGPLGRKRGHSILHLAVAILAALLSLGIASEGRAQTCPLYQTDFGSFSGPPDLVDGELRVLWCASGATIASSGFCPTGSALKLDSGTDDPVVLISTGAAGCTALEISFTYAQFAASGTIVRVGTTNATTASCTASTPVTLAALTATGGACTTFTATVQLAGAKGIYLRFDHGTNTNAILVDDFTVRRVGCCTPSHGCCETGAAGCSDAAVSACVCAQDPYCCEVEWDQLCVSEVDSFGCGTCVEGPSCLAGLALDFGTLYSGGSVCSKFPAVLERCEGAAPFLTSSLGCASTSDMAMRFSQGYPYSAAVTRCVSFADRTAPALRFSYSKQSGTLGPRIDVSFDGTAWITAWTAPVAFAGGCETLLLDLGPIAGEAAVWFRFTSASSVSNLAVFDDIELVEIDTTPHACCETGAPGCVDEATTACTCAIDAFCCEEAWDEVCVALATIYCDARCDGLPVCGSPTAGDCGLPHATPACADAACCVPVCEYDAYCCETAWDDLCVKEAAVLCAIPGDVDGDGAVGASDLAAVLAAWGASGGAEDVDGDGVVGAGDLSTVLSNWTG